MLASENAAARRIRPWMTDIGLVAAATQTDGQMEAAHRLWDYGSQNGLIPLFEQIPLRQSRFRFQEDDLFSFSPLAPFPRLTEFDDFTAFLGFTSSEMAWVAEVTLSDWTNLLRREAVRLGKGLNVQAIPTSTSVRIPCEARWNARQWSIHFEQPDWLTWEPTESLQAQRPNWDVVQSTLLDSLAYANGSFKNLPKLGMFSPTDAPWMRSLESLYAWHRSILVTNDLGLNPWVRRVWAAVWPVVYRERNKLRGECDLVALKREVAECFGSVPLLTEWMFIFARLACELICERGLGIAADFVEELP
jgi:hypothetical protein